MKLRVIAWILCIGCSALQADAGYAQVVVPDSSVVVRGDSQRIVSPRSALLRGALVPGWGQWYNRQYYKLPFVYGLLGGMTGLTIHFNSEFKQADDAYQYAARLGEEPNPYAEFEDEYIALGSPPAGSLRTFRDRQRRNRDLAFIGIVLAYGLSLLDAYVNAHLLTFDVSDDLTARSGGFLPVLSVRIRFGL